MYCECIFFITAAMINTCGNNSRNKGILTSDKPNRN